MAAMTQQASYTLRHAVASSIVVTVRPLGATLSSVLAPDRNGSLGEVTLGFDECEGDAPYLDGRSAYFGCVAGRVANRTKGAAFELDGAKYKLAANDGANHLHGGTVGFDKRRWTVVDASATALTLALRSGDGDEGYPGALDARVTYCLPDPKTLRVAYAATADKATPVNLTNHAYWNLNDGGASPVVDHELQVNAAFYTPVGDGAIPTGEIRRAAGAMDLSAGRRLGDALYDTDGGAGYDHNYARPRAGESVPPATARDRVPRARAGARRSRRARRPPARRGALRAGERPRHGRVHGPAGRPGLHGQLPRRRRRPRRDALRAPRGPLPRDPALPRRAPQRALPLRRAPPGIDLRARDGARLLRGRGAARALRPRRKSLLCLQRAATVGSVETRAPRDSESEPLDSGTTYSGYVANLFKFVLSQTQTS